MRSVQVFLLQSVLSFGSLFALGLFVSLLFDGGLLFTLFLVAMGYICLGAMMIAGGRNIPDDVYIVSSKYGNAVFPRSKAPDPQTSTVPSGIGPIEPETPTNVRRTSWTAWTLGIAAVISGSVMILIIIVSDLL